MRVQRVIVASAVLLAACGPALALRADEADDQYQVARGALSTETLGTGRG